LFGRPDEARQHAAIERSGDSGAPRTFDINRRAAGNIVIGQAAVL
jgi:hypothetical protein